MSDQTTHKGMPLRPMIQFSVYVTMVTLLTNERYRSMKRLVKISIIVVTLFILTSTAFGAGIALGGSGLLFEPGVARAAG